tara:strand:+ start:18258 stop:19229 length:972 start_codon:yes stop_codon:yes gene_type:complete
MKTIGLFIRPGFPYDWVNTKGIPWLVHEKSKEGVKPDIALFNYLVWKYPQYKFIKLYRTSFHKRTVLPDLVLMGFEELTLPYYKWVVKEKTPEKFKQFYGALKKVKNLYPTIPFIDFITDKCVYYKWLEKHKFGVAPTLCYDLKQSIKRKILKNIQFKTWNKIFMKPQPSAESKGAKGFNFPKNKKNISGHVNYLKSSKYSKAIVQKYINNFATKDYPELRTFWVGNKYVYTLETTEFGYDWNIRKKSLPPIVLKETKRLISLLEKKFDIPMLLLRIDWGQDRFGRFIINEIEYAPGVFAQMFPEKKWILDRLMGDRIIKKIL